MLLPVVLSLAVNKTAHEIALIPLVKDERVIEMFSSKQMTKVYLKGPICQRTTFPTVLAMLLA